MTMPKVKSRLKDKSPRHFIKQWRKARGLTLERLADRVGVTNSALSQLERGAINYTQPMLEMLAEALNCRPADLVGRPPDKEFGVDVEYERVMTILRSATPEERQRIEDIATVITRKAG